MWYRCYAFLGVWLRAGEGIGWLAAGTMPNSLYRMPLVYRFLACVFCYSCSFLFVVFCVFVFFFCSHWSLVDVPLIFFCPADHVPDWQPRILLGMALKKTGCQSVEATIRQRRLLFAGAMARQPAGRLPKRLMDGKLVGGEDPGKGRPEQNWMDCLKDDFQTFGATDGSTVDNRLTFRVDRAVWTLAAKMDDGAPWHKRVLQGAEKFMASWRKEEEEASRRRATKRDSRDLEPPTH